MLQQYLEAFLEDDASLDAEVFVNKASPFINAVDDLFLQLRYKVTYARVMDANRKFLDAVLHTNVLITSRELVTCVVTLTHTCQYVGVFRSFRRSCWSCWAKWDGSECE